MAGLLSTRRTATFAVTIMVGAGALAGCAESGSGASAGGDGVPAGTSKADYQAAFEDVSEITLRTQTPAPKGSVTGLPMEKYFEAVEDWSGGKIKWEIEYSNAVAEPAESDDALVDGRLDVASVLPIYEPSEYPANNALIESGFVSDGSAVNGALSSNAWPNQVAFETEEITQEFEDNGMVPLLPVYNSGANGLFCSDERTSLSDIDGITAASGGSAQSQQIEALGGEASSIPYPELFESLQRGVVDCTVSSPTVTVLGGFAAEAPHVVLDPAAGFALAPGALAISKTTWDGLPLVAQQLLWDRLDVFVGANVEEKVFANDAELAATVKEAGGQIQPFDADAREALVAENEKLLDELRSTDAVSDGDAFVESIEAANKEWQSKVAELGYPEVSYGEMDSYLEENEFDMTSYTELVTSEILDAHRPE